MNELKEILPFEKFKIAFAKFLEQADKNIISGKAIGTRKPFGITPIKLFYNNPTKSEFVGDDLTSPSLLSAKADISPHCGESPTSSRKHNGVYAGY